MSLQVLNALSAIRKSIPHGHPHFSVDSEIQTNDDVPELVITIESASNLFHVHPGSHDDDHMSPKTSAKSLEQAPASTRKPSSLPNLIPARPDSSKPPSDEGSPNCRIVNGVLVDDAVASRLDAAVACVSDGDMQGMMAALALALGNDSHTPAAAAPPMPTPVSALPFARYADHYLGPLHTCAALDTASIGTTRALTRHNGSAPRPPSPSRSPAPARAARSPFHISYDQRPLPVPLPSAAADADQPTARPAKKDARPRKDGKGRRGDSADLSRPLPPLEAAALADTLLRSVPTDLLAHDTDAAVSRIVVGARNPRYRWELRVPVPDREALLTHALNRPLRCALYQVVAAPLDQLVWDACPGPDAEYRVNDVVDLSAEAPDLAPAAPLVASPPPPPPASVAGPGTSRLSSVAASRTAAAAAAAAAAPSGPPSPPSGYRYFKIGSAALDLSALAQGATHIEADARLEVSPRTMVFAAATAMLRYVEWHQDEAAYALLRAKGDRSMLPEYTSDALKPRRVAPEAPPPVKGARGAAGRTGLASVLGKARKATAPAAGRLDVADVKIGDILALYLAYAAPVPEEPARPSSHAHVHGHGHGSRLSGQQHVTPSAPAATVSPAPEVHPAWATAVALDAEQGLLEGAARPPPRWVSVHGVATRTRASKLDSDEAADSAPRVCDVLVDTGAFGPPLPLHELLELLARRLNPDVDSTGYDADPEAPPAEVDDKEEHKDALASPHTLPRRVQALVDVLRGETVEDNEDEDEDDFDEHAMCGLGDDVVAPAAPAGTAVSYLAPLLEDDVAAEALTALASLPTLCAALPAHVSLSGDGHVAVSADIDGWTADPEVRSVTAHLTRLLRPAHALPDDLVLRIATDSTAVAVPLHALRTLRALALPFLALPPHLDVVDFLYRQHFRTEDALPAHAALSPAALGGAPSCTCECGCGIPASRVIHTGARGAAPATDAVSGSYCAWPAHASVALYPQEDPTVQPPPGVAVIQENPDSAAAAAVLPLLNQGVVMAANALLAEAGTAAAAPVPTLDGQVSSSAALAASLLDQYLPRQLAALPAVDGAAADTDAAADEAYAVVRRWLVRRLTGSTLTAGCARCLPTHLARGLHADTLRLLGADGLELLADHRAGAALDDLHAELAGAAIVNTGTGEAPHSRAVILRLAAALSAPARLQTVPADPAASEATAARAREIHSQVASGLVSLADALTVAPALARTASSESTAADTAPTAVVARWRQSCADLGCAAAQPLSPSSPALLSLLADIAGSPAHALPMLVSALTALPARALQDMFFSEANFPFVRAPTVRVSVSLPRPLLTPFELRHAMVLTVRTHAIRSLPLHWGPAMPAKTPDQQQRLTRGPDTRGARASQPSQPSKLDGKKSRKNAAPPAPVSSVAPPLIDVFAVGLPVAPGANAMVVHGDAQLCNPTTAAPVTTATAAAVATTLPTPTALPTAPVTARTRPSVALDASARVFLLPHSSAALYAHLARGHTLPLLCAMAKLPPQAYYSPSLLAAHREAGAIPDNTAFPDTQYDPASLPPPAYATAALDLTTLTLPGVEAVSAALPLRQAPADAAVSAVTRGNAWRRAAPAAATVAVPRALPSFHPEARLALDSDFPSAFSPASPGADDACPQTPRVAPTPAPAVPASPAPSPGMRSRLGKGKSQPEAVVEEAAEPESLDAARSELDVTVSCDREWFSLAMSGCTEEFCSHVHQEAVYADEDAEPSPLDLLMGALLE